MRNRGQGRHHGRYFTGPLVCIKLNFRSVEWCLLGLRTPVHRSRRCPSPRSGGTVACPKGARRPMEPRTDSFGQTRPVRPNRQNSGRPSIRVLDRRRCTDWGRIRIQSDGFSTRRNETIRGEGGEQTRRNGSPAISDRAWSGFGSVDRRWLAFTRPSSHRSILKAGFGRGGRRVFSGSVRGPATSQAAMMRGLFCGACQSFVVDTRSGTANRFFSSEWHGGLKRFRPKPRSNVGLGGCVPPQPKLPINAISYEKRPLNQGGHFCVRVPHRYHLISNFSQANEHRCATLSLSSSSDQRRITFDSLNRFKLDRL